MKLLLDTHTVLWFYLADPQLSVAASAAIMDPANEKWVSPASYWEVAIKISVGENHPRPSVRGFLAERYRQKCLPDSSRPGPGHAAAVATLPFPPNNHRDPFDRLIVAQALVEAMRMVADSLLDAYGITLIW